MKVGNYRNYKKGIFEYGCDVHLANDIKVGDLICLTHNRWFYVFDIDFEFINDEIADLYDDGCESQDILPEHSMVSIYDEYENGILKIPCTVPVIIFRRVDGKINPSDNILD